MLHVHSVVEECEIISLLHQIDPKTKKPMKKKPLFVKSGAVVVDKVQVREGTRPQGKGEGRGVVNTRSEVNRTSSMCDRVI